MDQFLILLAGILHTLFFTELDSTTTEENDSVKSRESFQQLALYFVDKSDDPEQDEDSVWDDDWKKEHPSFERTQCD